MGGPYFVYKGNRVSFVDKGAKGPLCMEEFSLRRTVSVKESIHPTVTINDFIITQMKEFIG